MTATTATTTFSGEPELLDKVVKKLEQLATETNELMTSYIPIKEQTEADISSLCMNLQNSYESLINGISTLKESFSVNSKWDESEFSFDSLKVNINDEPICRPTVVMPDLFAPDQAQPADNDYVDKLDKLSETISKAVAVFRATNNKSEARRRLFSDFLRVFLSNMSASQVVLKPNIKSGTMESYMFGVPGYTFSNIRALLDLASLKISQTEFEKRRKQVLEEILAPAQIRAGHPCYTFWSEISSSQARIMLQRYFTLVSAKTVRAQIEQLLALFSEASSFVEWLHNPPSTVDGDNYSFQTALDLKMYTDLTQSLPLADASIVYATTTTTTRIASSSSSSKPLKRSQDSLSVLESLLNNHHCSLDPSLRMLTSGQNNTIDDNEENDEVHLLKQAKGALEIIRNTDSIYHDYDREIACGASRAKALARAFRRNNFQTSVASSTSPLFHGRANFNSLIKPLARTLEDYVRNNVKNSNQFGGVSIPWNLYDYDIGLILSRVDNFGEQQQQDPMKQLMTRIELFYEQLNDFDKLWTMIARCFEPLELKTYHTVCEPYFVDLCKSIFICLTAFNATANYPESIARVRMFMSEMKKNDKKLFPMRASFRDIGLMYNTLNPQLGLCSAIVDCVFHKFLLTPHVHLLTVYSIGAFKRWLGAKLSNPICNEVYKLFNTITGNTTFSNGSVASLQITDEIRTVLGCLIYTKLADMIYQGTRISHDLTTQTPHLDEQLKSFGTMTIPKYDAFEDTTNALLKMARVFANSLPMNLYGSDNLYMRSSNQVISWSRICMDQLQLSQFLSLQDEHFLLNNRNIALFIFLANYEEYMRHMNRIDAIDSSPTSSLLNNNNNSSSLFSDILLTEGGSFRCNNDNVYFSEQKMPTLNQFMLACLLRKHDYVNWRVYEMKLLPSALTTWLVPGTNDRIQLITYANIFHESHYEEIFFSDPFDGLVGEERSTANKVRYLVSPYLIENSRDLILKEKPLSLIDIVDDKNYELYVPLRSSSPSDLKCVRLNQAVYVLNACTPLDTIVRLKQKFDNDYGVSQWSVIIANAPFDQYVSLNSLPSNMRNSHAVTGNYFHIRQETSAVDSHEQLLYLLKYCAQTDELMIACSIAAATGLADEQQQQQEEAAAAAEGPSRVKRARTRVNHQRAQLPYDIAQRRRTNEESRANQVKSRLGQIEKKIENIARKTNCNPQTPDIPNILQYINKFRQGKLKPEFSVFDVETAFRSQIKPFSSSADELERLMKELSSKNIQSSAQEHSNNKFYAVYAKVVALIAALNNEIERLDRTFRPLLNSLDQIAEEIKDATAIQLFGLFATDAFLRAPNQFIVDELDAKNAHYDLFMEKQSGYLIFNCTKFAAYIKAHKPYFQQNNWLMFYYVFYTRLGAETSRPYIFLTSSSPMLRNSSLVFYPAIMALYLSQNLEQWERTNAAQPQPIIKATATAAATALNMKAEQQNLPTIAAIKNEVKDEPMIVGGGGGGGGGSSSSENEFFNFTFNNY